MPCSSVAYRSKCASPSSGLLDWVISWSHELYSFTPWDSPPETGHPGEDYNCRCIARPVRARSQEEIEAFLREDAIEPVYPELYVIPAITAREVASIGVIRIGSAIWRIFRNPIARRPKEVPKDWKKRLTRGEDGTIYEKPGTKGTTNVRVMKAKPNSSNPGQQNDYVTWQKDGKFLDVNGNIVPRQSGESHIPLKKFKFKKDIFQ